jgi:hypothetical protein
VQNKICALLRDHSGSTWRTVGTMYSTVESNVDKPFRRTGGLTFSKAAWMSSKPVRILQLGSNLNLQRYACSSGGMASKIRTLWRDDVASICPMVGTVYSTVESPTLPRLRWIFSRTSTNLSQRTDELTFSKAAWMSLKQVRSAQV